MTHTPFIVSKKIALVAATLLLSSGLVACGDKPENPAVGNPAGTAEKEIPMSAKPADAKKTPIAVGEEDNVGKDNGGKGNVSGTEMASSGTATTDMPNANLPNQETVVPVKGDSSTETTTEGGVDNSGMDKISENDQVIDEAPASPDAPKAVEEKSEISNPPTGHKKK